MPNIPLGGAHKQFYRVIDAHNEFMPDADTLATREYEAAGDTSTNGLNTQCDNVTTASQGFIVPPGEEFQVHFKGAAATIASTCVIQHYDPFLAAWVTLETIVDPHIAKVYKLKTYNPVRIGVTTYQAGDAPLSLNVIFAQSDRGGH